MTSSSWLTVTRGEAPLVVSIPHTGTDLAGLENRLVSPWLGRRDADWWIDRLYDFAAGLGATVVHTAISRTVIDVNRDPSGVSLYPGQATTTLCPTDTFDGDPLYKPGEEPGTEEIAERRGRYFDPYQAALGDELARLRKDHPAVVLYDCHSIRSVLPRLFEPFFTTKQDGMGLGLALCETLVERVDGRIEAMNVPRSGACFTVTLPAAKPFRQAAQ
ncbi:N-formylglutamate amidohydrolase [Rhizobiaceae sp. 2RAB30]